MVDSRDRPNFRCLRVVEYVWIIIHDVVILHGHSARDLVMARDSVKFLNLRRSGWEPNIVFVTPADVLFAFFISFVTLLVVIVSVGYIDFFDGSFIGLFPVLGVAVYGCFSCIENCRSVPSAFCVQAVDHISLFEIVPPVKVINKGAERGYLEAVATDHSSPLKLRHILEMDVELLIICGLLLLLTNWL